MSKKLNAYVEEAQFYSVSQVIQESRSWIDLKEIVILSDVPLSSCKVILAQLISSGVVGTKLKQITRSSKPALVYAKRSIVDLEEKQRNSDSAFKYAKSRFQLWPELMDGKTHRIYNVQPNQLLSLAMLTRPA